ncbi:MAG TPA: hypothetical protein PK360_01340 [bacterium]|nr:hypothetical protein [bacterium]
MKLPRIPAVDRYLCLFLFGALALSFAGHGSSVDENLIIQVTESLVEHGELTVANMFQALPGPDGKYYSRYGIGFPVVMIPFYLLGTGLDWLFPRTYAFFGNARFFAMLWGNLLITVLTGWLFYRLCRMVEGTEKASAGLALALIMTTPFWPYSQTLYRLTAAGAVLTGALLLILSIFQKPSRANLTGLGGLIALGLNLREDLVFAFLLMGLFVLWRGEGAGKWRCAAAMIAGAAGGVVIWGIHNSVRFGQVFIENYEDLSFDYPLILSLPQLIWGQRHGLVPYAPLALLLPLSYAAARKKGNLDLWLLCAAVMVVYFGLYGKSSMWHGGICWGPRHLYFLLPFCLLPGVWLWDNSSTRWIRWPVGAGILLGIVMNWPGVYSHNGKYQDFFSSPSFFSLVAKPVVHPDYITFDELDLWWIRMIKLEPLSLWPVLFGALLLFTAWSGYRLWNAVGPPRVEE